jgi:hypothetical protein
VANNRYAYQLRVGDALAENDKKLRAAGYDPPELVDTAFHIPIIGSYLSIDNTTEGTMFQDIMAHDGMIAGPDERYDHASKRSAKLRADIKTVSQMIEDAKVKRPDLGIQTIDEVHNGVVADLKRKGTSDPRASWMAGLGEFVGAMGNSFSPSDPFAVVKAPLLAFTGVGPNVAMRVVSMAAAQAGVGLAERATDPTNRRAMLGLPEETTGDLLLGVGVDFAFGAAFGVLGEGLSGAAGREALNKSYSWMSLSKRNAKSAPLRVPGPPPEPPAPPAPPPPGPDLAALAGRPAGPGPFQRLGEGAPVGLPGLPRGKLPTTLPEHLAEQIPIPGEDAAAGVNRSLDLTEGAAITHVPRHHQTGTIILSKFTTKAQKVRAAKDMDHAEQQLAVDGVAPQDLVGPSRALDRMATRMPDVRVWNGPGAGMTKDLDPATKTWISRRVDDQIAADPGTDPAEYAAREHDPETWAKADSVLERLNAAKAELQRITGFHGKVAAGDKTALDATIMQLENARMRARSAGGRAAIANQLEETLRYHKELAKTRPGGKRPEAPKHLDQQFHAGRVMLLEEEYKALYPEIERSFERSKGAYGLSVQEAEALEQRLRGTHRDWINQSFKWPKDVKRLRKDKNPYEVQLLKGPTQKQLFAERELMLEQLSDPVAREGALPGEGPADVAIRVNEAKMKEGEESTPAMFERIGKFLEDTGFIKRIGEEAPAAPKAALPAERVAKINAEWMKDPNINSDWQLKLTGEIVDIKTRNVIGRIEGDQPVVPRMPSGEALGNLAVRDGFEVDGKNVDMATAWADVKSEIESLSIFNKCSTEP